MRRYLFNTPFEEFDQHEADVAIIGSGIAGLYAAYNIDEDKSCVIFTKDKTDVSSSSLAQGGIAVVLESEDKFEYHFEDTVKAGAGHCDEAAVHTIVEEGPDDINRLIDLGINFDTDSEGHLKATMEGGHGRRRILHSGGDATGKEIVRILKQMVKERSNVELLQKYFVADIITDENDKVCGVAAYNNGWHFFRTNHVIVASGGIGQVYRYTTNPLVATGDGIAMAKRAGAEIVDMEFVQFHPTGFYSSTNRNKQCFLISEAVRGEGGLLYNDKGERFMVGRHERCELAPRDIVAREIYREIENQASPYVNLDISFKEREFLESRFPTIYNNCMVNGVDIAKEPIPVGPAQHYIMGGIKSDLDGRTNIEGLYTCGEAACTGVHGANRLASNSTLECLVFGRRAAQSINSKPTRKGCGSVEFTRQNISGEHIDLYEESINLKGIMVKYCGILRSDKYLRLGFEKAHKITQMLEEAELSTVEAMELYNMCLVSEEIFKAAIARKKSMGAHYREDDIDD
ncbi:MAG: L-aspartate oxidase [Clostridia bacterium]|nr:L-aspartate oxidase [Clostridia bacterium]